METRQVTPQPLRTGSRPSEGPSRRRGGKLGRRPVRRLSIIQNILITDTSKIDPLKAAQNLPPNSAIILRDYQLAYKQRLKIGGELKKICRQRKIPLLIAKDFKLALALNADGMHFPEMMLATARRTKAKKPNWLITIAAHSSASVRAAYANNLDAVLISPVKKTASHPHKKPIGIHRAALFIYRSIDAYALGGIEISDKKLLQNKGFAGISGISWAAGCVKNDTVDV